MNIGESFDSAGPTSRLLLGLATDLRSLKSRDPINTLFFYLRFCPGTQTLILTHSANVFKTEFRFLPAIKTLILN
jgi:hypothetical protein